MLHRQVIALREELKEAREAREDLEKQLAGGYDELGVAGGASITKHLLAAREQAAASDALNTQLQKQLAANQPGGRRGSVPSLAKEVNCSHPVAVMT